MEDAGLEAEGGLALRLTLPLSLVLANAARPAWRSCPVGLRKRPTWFSCPHPSPLLPGLPQDSGVSALREGPQTGLPLVVCVSPKIPPTGSLNSERRSHPANDSRRHQIRVRSNYRKASHLSPFTGDSSVLWTSHSDSDQSNHVSASHCQALRQKLRKSNGKDPVPDQRGERNNTNPPVSEDSRETTPLLTWGGGGTNQPGVPSAATSQVSHQHLQVISSHHTLEAAAVTFHRERLRDGNWPGSRWQS